MTQSNSIIQFQDLANKLIGFDSLFDTFYETPNFPPCDVIKQNNDYVIRYAVAGYNKDEITVEHDKAQGVLIVSGEKKTEEFEPSTFTYVKRGIASRKFTVRTAIDSNHEVDAVTLKDGILCIMINYEVPEELKSRKIDIL